MRIMTELEWERINKALLISVSLCMLHAKDHLHDAIEASTLMDDIANDEDSAEEDD